MTEQVASSDPYPVAGAYFGRINKWLDAEADSKAITLAFAQKLGTPYFMTILRLMADLDRICREMAAVLDEFTGRQIVFGRLLTPEHLATAMKLYVISWSTARDLLAALINATFDLGIAERDVTEHLVLRNAHVSTSRIAEILRDYDRRTLIENLKKKRNDVVHRGRIPDPEVERISTERTTLDSLRYSVLQTAPLSGEEYQRQMHLLYQKLTSLATQKQALWRNHHQQMLQMIAKVAEELADRTLEMCKKESV